MQILASIQPRMSQFNFFNFNPPLVISFSLRAPGQKVKAKAEARQEKAAEEAGMVVAKPPGEPRSFSSYADSAPRWGVEKNFEKKTRYSQTGIASIPSTPLPVLFRDCCAKNGDKMALSVERGDLSDAAAFPPKLKGSIGEGSNHSNYSHQSSVKILSKSNAFC